MARNRRGEGQGGPQKIEGDWELWTKQEAISVMPGSSGWGSPGLSPETAPYGVVGGREEVSGAKQH